MFCAESEAINYVILHSILVHPPSCSRSCCVMMMLCWLLSSLSRSEGGESVRRGPPSYQKINYSRNKIHHTPSFSSNQAFVDL